MDPSPAPNDTPARAAWEPGSPATVQSVHARTETTQPRSRLSEAALIGELERSGVGRPSTYSQAAALIQERGHVQRAAEGKLSPTWAGLALFGLLSRTAPHLLEASTTAQLEAQLDRVARGELSRVSVITNFHRGETGIENAYAALKKCREAHINLPALEGSGISVIYHQGAVFVRSGTVSAQLPQGAAPETLTAQQASQALLDPDRVSLEHARASRKETLRQERTGHALGTDTQTGLTIWLRQGPRGRYLQLGEDTPGARAWRGSVPTTEDVSTLTPERARLFLELNRDLGIFPDGHGELSGQAVRVGLGRYGPYVKAGKTFRPLDVAEARSLDLAQATALLTEPPRPGSGLKSTHPELRRDGSRRGGTAGAPRGQ